MGTNTQPRAEIANLQFLRFLAAMMVVLFHGASDIAPQLHADSRLVTAFQYIGFSGVDLFFVISGFIIYLSNTRTTHASGASRFLALRLARIYLGYWPFFLIGWGVLSFFATDHPDTIDMGKINLVNSFFLLPDKSYAALLDVTWSLSHELYFYLIFFFLLFAKRRLEILLCIAAGIIAFNLFAAYALDAYTWKGFKNLGDTERFLTSPWILEFSAGAVVAHCILRGYSRFTVAATLIGIACFFLGYYLNITLLDGKIAKFFNYHFRMTIFGLGSALLIYGLVNLERKGMVIGPRFSLLFGGASYCMYLLHRILFDIITYSGTLKYIADISLPPTFKYIAIIVFVQFMAVFFYMTIEKPVYRKAKKMIHFYFNRAASKHSPTPRQDIDS